MGHFYNVFAAKNEIVTCQGYREKRKDLMKTKVLHLIHGMTIGGAETLVKDYFLLIDKDKFDVVLLCMSRHDTAYEQILEEAGIRIIYVSDKIEQYIKPNCGVFGKVFRRLALYHYIKQIIREEKPDVIHTHLPVNRYVAFANPPKSTRIFHTVHSEPRALWNRSLERRIEFQVLKKIIRKYDFHFIALHEEMKREIENVGLEILEVKADKEWRAILMKA